MAMRRQMSRGGSRSYFTAGAKRVHRKNFLVNSPGPGPMRGGIRL